METPVIVKKIGGGYDPFNVHNRLAQMNQQFITNRQAYDLTYKSHEDYYKDKQIHVFDDKFKSMEEHLVKDLKNAIDKSIDYKSFKNLDDVNDLDKKSLNVENWNFKNIARNSYKSPPSPKYVDSIPKNAVEYVTDPYAAIVGR
jgi:hypothetical protein